MCKAKNTFIGYIFFKSRELEKLDINNKKKSFIKRNFRYLFSIVVSFLLVFTITSGYSNDFLQLSASILSILIGLFITALVFALDKFYIPRNNNVGDYNVEIKEKEETKNIEISIDKITNENANDKLWQKQSLYYVQKFNVLVGKSVIVGVMALALICINVIFLDFFSIDISDYELTHKITSETVLSFITILVVVIVRFIICYFMIEVFYNTINIISSMVNFMSVRIKK